MVFYELEVEEKRKEVASMTSASYLQCQNPNVLRSMHFMGMFDIRAGDVTLSDLTSEQIKSTIDEVVQMLRTKTLDSRVLKAALPNRQIPINIDEPRMRVKHLVTDYFERMENIGYCSFKEENPGENFAARDRSSLSSKTEADRAKIPLIQAASEEGCEGLHQICRGTSRTCGLD